MGRFRGGRGIYGDYWGRWGGLAVLDFLAVLADLDFLDILEQLELPELLDFLEEPALAGMASLRGASMAVAFLCGLLVGGIHGAGVAAKGFAEHLAEIGGVGEACGIAHLRHGDVWRGQHFGGVAQAGGTDDLRGGGVAERLNLAEELTAGYA